MKPLLSYYGGKQRIASHIVEVIASIPHTRYVEPFAGGAAVLFAKGPGPKGDGYIEVINDKDERLIALYRACQTHKDELVHILTHTPYSKSEHEKARQIIKSHWDSTPLVWQAWAMVVAIRQSFGKKLCGSWARSSGTNVQAGGIARNEPSVWANYLEALPVILERLQGVYIECGDAVPLITRYDTPHTLYYCDPPYPGTDQKGYNHKYTLDDWASLCETLDTIKGSYVLSGYHQDIAPKSAERVVKIEAKCSVNALNSNKERTECLWIKQAVGVERTQTLLF